MIQVSVIVPVYNVEKYLRKCLDSLVCQTLKDIEIIVVNDGSKDHSKAIIEEYVNKYHHILSFKKENGGLSSARNFGIDHASGEYISFVDSDDYIAKDMLEKMYLKAKEHDFDLVMCDFSELHDDGIRRYSCHLDHDLYSKEEIQHHMVDYYPSAWNKLYKRILLEKVRFKEGVWFEDVEMGYRLLPFVNTIGVVREHFYNYLIRYGSITSTVDPRIYHYIENWNGILDFYKRHDFYDLYKEELEYCYVRYLFATFIKAAAKYNKNEFKKAVDQAILNVEKAFPDYRNNHYLNKKGWKNQYLKRFNRLFAFMIYYTPERIILRQKREGK